MRYRPTLAILIISFLLSAFALGGIFASITPPLSLFYFYFLYFALFLTLLSFFTSIALYWRHRYPDTHFDEQLLGLCLRQSFLLTVATLGLLYLSSRNELIWWKVTGIIVSVALLEFIFQNAKNRKTKKD